jgi:hypothetical protein
MKVLIEKSYMLIPIKKYVTNKEINGISFSANAHLSESENTTTMLASVHNLRPI